MYRHAESGVNGEIARTSMRGCGRERGKRRPWHGCTMRKSSPPSGSAPTALSLASMTTAIRRRLGCTTLAYARKHDRTHCVTVGVCCCSPSFGWGACKISLLAKMTALLKRLAAFLSASTSKAWQTALQWLNISSKPASLLCVCVRACVCAHVCVSARVCVLCVFACVCARACLRVPE